MQAQTPTVVRSKGWYSDSLSIKNRYTDIQQQQIKAHVQTLSGTLQLQKCPQANLITMISQIPFPKLISLDLANNLISSVHGLADLYAPELKEIRLCHNFITSVKNLRRGYWPKLAFLNLKQNKILDYQYLTQLKLQDRFEFLTISTRRQLNQVPSQDISWLGKLQPSTIYINHYLDPRRYNEQQQTLMAKLQQKMSILTKKYTNRNAFDTSNCYDLR